MFEELVKKKRRTGPSVKLIVASIMFGAIIMTFVFFGFNPRDGAITQGGAAAVVNGRMISARDVDEQVQILRQNPFFAQFGGQDRSFLQRQAVETLVSSELIAHEAENQGLLVPDLQIRDTIVNEPFFQEGGRFKRERYLGYLQQVGKSASEFEHQQRKDQMRQRTVRLLQLALSPTEMEIQKQIQLREIQANAEFVAIPSGEVVKPSSIATADVDAFLKSEPGQKKAREYYDLHKAEFTKAATESKPGDKTPQPAPEAMPFEQVREQIARTVLAEEKSAKSLDEIREIVKSGDLGAVNKWVQARGLKWDETGAFGIENPAVPKIGENSEFADAAFRLTSEKPLLDKLIRQGPNTYIVKYKQVTAAAKQEAQKPEELKDLIASNRTQDAFGRWVKSLRESARINYSNAFTPAAGEAN